MNRLPCWQAGLWPGACPASCTSAGGVHSLVCSLCHPVWQQLENVTAFMRFPDSICLDDRWPVLVVPSPVRPSWPPALGKNVWTFQRDLNSKRTAIQVDSDRDPLLWPDWEWCCWVIIMVWNHNEESWPNGMSVKASLQCQILHFPQQQQPPRDEKYYFQPGDMAAWEVGGKKKSLILCQHKLSGILNVHA